MTPSAANLSDAISSIREKIKSSNTERHDLAKQLTQIIVDAQGLLGELGEAQAPTMKRRGRPAGSKNAPSGRKRRKMSAKARKAISDAQKARWAKQKAKK